MMFRTIYKGYDDGDEPIYHLEIHRQSLIKHLLGKLGDWMWDRDLSSRKILVEYQIPEKEAFRIQPYWKKAKARDDRGSA